jgi:hypothetical protein
MKNKQQEEQAKPQTETKFGLTPPSGTPPEPAQLTHTYHADQHNNARHDHLYSLDSTQKKKKGQSGHTDLDVQPMKESTSGKNCECSTLQLPSTSQVQYQALTQPITAPNTAKSQFQSNSKMEQNTSS